MLYSLSLLITYKYLSPRERSEFYSSIQHFLFSRMRWIVVMNNRSIVLLIILFIYRQTRSKDQSSLVKTHFDDFTNSFERSPVEFYREAHFSVSLSVSETNSVLTVRFEELVKEWIFSKSLWLQELYSRRSGQPSFCESRLRYCNRDPNRCPQSLCWNRFSQSLDYIDLMTKDMVVILASLSGE